MFLSGYASDMEGTKASFLAKKAKENKVAFVRFDYRGCGKSNGKFSDGTIGKWLEDSLAVFDRLTEGPQIVVGSSMGGWLGLLLAQARASRVKALIGVAAAPDFTEELIWNKMATTERDQTLATGLYREKGAAAPFYLSMIEEARAHLILREGGKIKIPSPVRLLQGMKDKDVHWRHALKIVDRLESDDVKLTLVKKGDHSLSAPRDLETLWRTLSEFLP